MPTRSRGGVHACSEPPGQQNERDDDQTDQCADQQAQDEYEMIFAEPELIQPATKFESERGQRILTLSNYGRGRSRNLGGLGEATRAIIRRNGELCNRHGVIIPLRTA